MGIGAISVSNAATPADPGGLAIAFSSAMSYVFKDYLPFTCVPMSGLVKVLISNGMDAMRNVLEGASYRNGILPPKAAQTTEGTATRATAYLDSDGTNFTDGQIILVGTPTGQRNIWASTTLVTDGTRFDQFKIGANINASLENLRLLIEDEGTDGNEYYNYMHQSGITPVWHFHEYGGIECPSAVDTVNNRLLFRAVAYGIAGNSIYAHKFSVMAWLTFGTGSPGKLSGGASGTGEAPLAGTYKHRYAHFRYADDAQSAVSPEVEITTGDNGNINQTAFVDAHARDAADYFRWMRNTAGGALYYRGKDVPVATAEPYVDDQLDTDLRGNFTLIYDSRIHRDYKYGYPTVFRAGCVWKNIPFGAGALLAADYSIGTVAVTEDSDTFTFSTLAAPKEDWIGRYVNITGTADLYLIVSVDESARTVVVNNAYRGTTAAAASYTVQDRRDPFEVYYAPAGKPNNWPGAYSVKGASSPDPRGITSLIPGNEAVLAYTMTGLWKILGSVGAFRFVPVGESMGAFSQNAVVNVGGTLYWIGPQGCWRWNGDGNPVSLSEPPDQGRGPRGILETMKRVNLDQADLVVGDYNSQQHVIRWLLALDNSDTNTHVLTLHLQTMSFSLDVYEDLTFIRSIVGSDARERTFAGDAFGAILELDVGTSDGAFDFSCVQTLTGYTAATRTLTVAGTPFPTTGDGLASIPAVLVNPTTGDFYQTKIATNTNATLVLVGPPSATPAAGWQVVVGGILLDIETGDWDLNSPEVYKTLVSVTVGLLAAAGGQLWCAASIDGGTPTCYTINSTGLSDVALLATADAEYVFWHRLGKGRRVRIRFVAVAPGVEVGLVAFSAKVRGRFGQLAGSA